MDNIDKNLKGIIVDDHKLMLDGLAIILSKQINADIEKFTDSQLALNRLNTASKLNHKIDFITTDIQRPGINGIEFIKNIRNLNDNILYHNGLRIRHIPIIVLSMFAENSDFKKEIKKISEDIICISKNIKPEELTSHVVKSIAKYRKDITDEFIREGYSILFENGKYKICNTFKIEPSMETKYFEGLSNSAAKAITRKILVQNTSVISSISISILEDMINNTNVKEKDFHEFFLLFPEFLLNNNYDILYSENTFKNLENRYRTDIVAQPRGLHSVADQWAIIELKKHNEKILTNKKYHANFSKSVYNGICQLKNYYNYFKDPRNFDEIRSKYNGIVPEPKLTLVIGRTPNENFALYSKMKSQFPEINIMTYDEILNFRKIQVQYLANFGM